ncbi:MAG: hypothetical protein JKY49_08760 [Cohaesibacteraceae bacterium]|nr:hypothetical protein [Cohaesibacteraceae bacterium]
MDFIPVTPFGSAGVTPDMVKSQMNCARITDFNPINKWDVLRYLSCIRKEFNLGDRAITVLQALLSFHKGDVLDPKGNLIVFASNQKLCARAHNISEATLRRHIARLVQSGILIRRDSPNGKRYSRLDSEGTIKRAFGLDITPLIVRFREFAAKAKEIVRQQKELAIQRETISLLRRDLRKTLVLANQEFPKVSWEMFSARLEQIVLQRLRNFDATNLLRIQKELEVLAHSVQEMLKTLIETAYLNGNIDQIERHIYDSNQNIIAHAELEAIEKPPLAKTPAPLYKTRSNIDLKTVLQACPDIQQYSTSKIITWNHFIDVIEKVRPMLGLSMTNWQKIKSVMGPLSAAVTLCGILQRIDQIASPAGYLQSLSKRSGFSPLPMIMALCREQLKSSRVAFDDTLDGPVYLLANKKAPSEIRTEPLGF